MQREDVERLERTLRSHPGLNALQLWAMRDEAANTLRALLAERDAAFAAGQEEMRRRAVAATVSVETDHPSWVNAGSWACASELCGIRINDLPIKPRP